MTSEEQKGIEKRKEWQKKKAILAHSIAEQITSIPNITFQGALEIAEIVKETIERDMKQTRAHTTKEIRDRWGKVIEIPQECPWGKNAN